MSTNWPPRPEGHTPDKTGRPDEPWLTREAIEILDVFLTKEMKVFEFGCGSSTIWFSRRCLQVLSIEHDRSWRERVQNVIRDEKLPAVVNYGSKENGYKEYLDAAETALGIFSPYDLVLVDGRCRVKSVRIAAPFVRLGGFIVLDNAERPWYAPVREILSGWEVLETSNGIWRTDFYMKMKE